MSLIFRIFLILFIFLTGALHSKAQTIEAEFGKNRVQYHSDFDVWKKYETENFITYWYGKARNIAVPAMQIAEQEHARIQDIMEHKMNDKIQILVYTDITDFNQSNIGLEDVFISKTGEIKIEENKMFIYSKGDYPQLLRDLRKGIASVYLNEMLLGDSFRETVQNAVQLSIPDWYRQGIIAYAGDEWNYLADDELRDLLTRDKKYSDFFKLAEDHPRIAGQSMWNYIKYSYGESTISNILYLTRITRSVNEGLLYVLNEDTDNLVEGWSGFYKNKYQKEEGRYVQDESHLVGLINKPEVPISAIVYNPSGDQLAYAINELARINIYIRDLKTNKDTRVYRYGSKNSLQSTDFNYPLLAWRADGKELSYVVEKKDKIYIRKYDLNTEESIEQVIPTALNRIYSLSYISDYSYLITGDTDGFTDLYIYETKNRTFERISQDFYDDREAIYTTFAGKKGIIFSSNRINNNLLKERYDTIIPTGDFNLFFYDLEADDSSLLRLTNTPSENERYPISASDNRVIYLSEKSGINNAYVFYLSENYSYPITNKSRNIIRHSYEDGHYGYTYYQDGSYKFFIEEVDITEEVVIDLTSEVDGINKRKEIHLRPPVIQVEKDSIKEGFLFQTEYGDPEELEEIDNKAQDKNSYAGIQIFKSEEEEGRAIAPFVNSEIVPAKVQFRIADFITKLDNEVLFEGLESYTENNRSVFTPLGLLLKAEMLDLFEDYSLTGGVRVPLSFKGAEYFLVYEDRKKKIDKRYALYRKTNNEIVDDSSFPVERMKTSSLLGLVQWKYPFDVFRSVKFTTTLRFDNTFNISSDNATFESPTINNKRFIGKLEYVFDNTLDYAYNIKHGTRYKIYAEGINEFNISVIDSPGFNLSEGITGILGFDARHYIQLLKHSVIALRTAGATSFGTKKNLFYLGGVNNNLFSAFNTSTPVGQEDYLYQTNVFHLRGFDNNIRNGTSYALVNTEVRVPFFKYLLGPYKGSSFLRNIMLVGFFDMGTAWYGSSPYSDKNPLNSIKIERPSSNGGPPIIEVDVRYYRDPLVMGYGAGLRFSMFGYLVRLDMSKGIETRVVQDRVVNLSLGKDF